MNGLEQAIPILGIPVAVGAVLAIILWWAVGKAHTKIGKFDVEGHWEKWKYFYYITIGISVFFGAAAFAPYFGAILTPLGAFLAAIGKGTTGQVNLTQNPWPLNNAKLDVAVGDTLGAGIAKFNGTFVVYTASGPNGQLIAKDSITVTSGGGQSTRAMYSTGEKYYGKLTIGSQVAYYGPFTLPMIAGGATATVHTWPVDFILLDTSGFSISCMYKGSAIASYGEYNATTKGDTAPTLSFQLSENTLNKGFVQYLDMGKNIERQLLVVVRLNDTHADDVQITGTPTGMPDGIWWPGRSSTDDRYFFFVPGDHLYLWRDSNNNELDAGSIPFSLALDMSNTHAGSSVRLCVQLYVNSNWNYYQGANGQPSRATLVATQIVYLKW